MRFPILLVALLALGACGEKPETVEDLHTRIVTLPAGQIVKVEVMFDPMDMMRGLMFRQSLPPGHGMLFEHRAPGNYTYWMFQTLIPLDIIWMDASHRVVELVENAPPCQTDARQCPHYGGHEISQYVLEIGGGQAAKYGVRKGDFVGF